MRRPTLLLLMLALASGCADDLCGDEAELLSLELRVITPLPIEPIEEPLLLHGTLDANVAITRLFTDIAVAEPDPGTENFSRFTIELPAEGIVAEPGQTVARLPIYATDVCGTLHELYTLELPAFGQPSTAVSELSLGVAFADPHACFLPADGSAAAQLVVRAAASGAGGLVTMQATGGELDDALLDDEGRVRLRAEGDVAAARVDLFAGDSEVDRVTIRASAYLAQTQSRQVTVAAAPRLSAGAEVLAPGGQTTVLVSSEGILEACTAFVTDPDAVTVTVRDGGDLQAGEQPVGSRTCPAVDEQGELTSDLPRGTDLAILDVAFGPTATTTTLATIRCWDAHQQDAELTITVETP